MRLGLLLLTLLFVGTPAQAGTSCGAAPPKGPVGLPDTILVKGACGTFALRPDGIVEAVHPPDWAPPWAPGAQARANDGTYILHRHGHLVLVRDAGLFWRSHLAHGSDDVVVHGKAIAFTAYERPSPDLWVARVGGSEHLAGRGEDLQGWAKVGGFFAQRGRQLLVRAPDGRLRKHLLSVRTTVYEPRTETLLALTTSGLLVRTDGNETRRLANLSTLGVSPRAWLAVLSDGLISINSQQRMLLLRQDGTRFASASFGPSSKSKPPASVVSEVLPLPGERGVVFVVNRRYTWKDGGIDRVLLLDRGHRVPRVLYARRAGPPQCGYWANLSLHGETLLYWPSSGRALVALDARGAHAPFDLWPIIRHVPGLRHRPWLRRAGWLSTWNR